MPYQRVGGDQETRLDAGQVPRPESPGQQAEHLGGRKEHAGRRAGEGAPRHRLH